MKSIRKAMIYEISTGQFLDWSTVQNLEQSPRSRSTQPAGQRVTKRKASTQREPAFNKKIAIQRCVEPANKSSQNQPKRFRNLPIEPADHRESADETSDDSNSDDEMPDEEQQNGFIPIALRGLHESQIEPDYLGRLDLECPHCGALYFTSEKPSFNKCCKEGHLKLTKLQTPPEVLRKLFDYSDTEHSDEFHENIRALNMISSFASTGEKGLDRSLANMKNGVYVYRINNTIHHFMGSLLPTEGESSKFSQFYIFDNTEDSVQEKSKVFPKITKGLLTKVEDCLRKNNDLIKKYKQIGKEVLSGPNYRLAIKDDCPNIDMRVYNQAAPNQIAGIVPSKSDLRLPRDIIIRQKDNKLQRISHHHPACLPLTYALLYPRGEPGYSPRLTYTSKTEKNTKVTLRAFVCYHLQIRRNSFNILQRSGKLFLQWLVDMYCAIESERLEWYRSHQKTIKADTYINLVEAHRRAKSARDIGNNKLNFTKIFKTNW